MTTKKRSPGCDPRAKAEVGGTTNSFFIVYANRANIASTTVSERQRMAGVCLSREELAEWRNQYVDPADDQKCHHGPIQLQETPCL